MTELTGQAGVSEMVERTGVWFSSFGLSRATGQIFGFLMTCDPAEQSAGDIAVGTSMSRASVSSGSRMLVQLGAIEERHRVGDRKTYYRLRSDWWVQAITTEWSGIERLADEARRIRAAGGVTRTDGLDELIAFSEFWIKEISKLREHWEQERSQQAQKEEA
jgi:DNA-binding transcriptional regulator GbsR (MarR family)